MLELNDEQRRIIVDKVPDMANVAAGAMVFGQFLADRPFSLMLGVAGAAGWLVVAGWTLYLTRRRKP